MYECGMCTRMPFWVPWIGKSMNYIRGMINFYNNNHISLFSYFLLTAQSYTRIKKCSITLLLCDIITGK
jgi:hypothetical protein